MLFFIIILKKRKLVLIILHLIHMILTTQPENKKTQYSFYNLCSMI